MSDTYTAAGAKSLADTIRAYWRNRGEQVSVWIEQIEYERSLGNLRHMFVVKSDLLNGLPRLKRALAA